MIFMYSEEIQVLGNHMKVVLADPPDLQKSPYALTCANLGILYIMSYLREHNLDVDVYYLPGYLSTAQHINAINRIKPDILGISFAGTFSSFAVNYINHIKEEYSDCLVVCGGAHATSQPLDILENSKADVCCIGEGEITFSEIINAQQLGGNIKDIAGIIYKDNSQKIIANPNRQFHEKLDNLPFPSWEIVNFERYMGYNKAMGKKSAHIVASRGCPYNCWFCSNPVWKHQKPWIRKRSPENIAREVSYLYDLGIREIYIRSDEMNFDVNWCIAVFNTLADLKKTGLFFQCNLTANLITDELAYALKRANCWLVYIGIESFSDKVLKGIQKPTDSTQISSSLEVLHSHQFKVFAFLMLFQIWESKDKLCFETTRECFRTLLQAFRLFRTGRIHYMSCGIATPYPGSRLYDTCLKYDLFRNSGQGELVLPQNITTIIPGVRKFEMMFVRNIGVMMQGIFYLFSFKSKVKYPLVANIPRILNKIKYLSYYS